MDTEPNKSNKRIIIVAIGIIVAIAAVFAYISAFGAPQKNAEIERFIVGISDSASEVSGKLKTEGFIKNLWGYNIAYRLKGGRFTAAGEIQPGAYKISKSMSVWELTDVLKQGPYMEWVVIPEGLRKEEIAAILASALGWSNEDKEKWVSTYTAMDFDYVEGVYFPDTYLIPVDEPPLEVANRLRAKFNEKFAPYAKEALRENIKWDTLLKVASIVQREAASKDDMPLIAGILWNRLQKNMRLEADATLQYARGDTGNGWWSPVSAADKQIDSPYNTYKHTGLPPHPISNPGLDAINAVLHSEETKCLYYLHDSSKITHCAETYEEHQANIERYLRRQD